MATTITAAAKLRRDKGPASWLVLFLWIAGLLAILMLSACTDSSSEELSEKDAVKGVVREAFAHPDRLCTGLATSQFVETLGGEEKCLADARPLTYSSDRRGEGKGYTLAGTRIQGDTATVKIETPDFGRYDGSLVREGGNWRINAVDYRGVVPRTTSP